MDNKPTRWADLFLDLNHAQNELRRIYNSPLLKLLVWCDTWGLGFDIIWDHLNKEGTKPKAIHISEAELTEFAGSIVQFVIERLRPENAQTDGD